MATDRTSATVDEYLDRLDDDRRTILGAVRSLIGEHLPAGYVETMLWGMPSYVVPLERYPTTYNDQPLTYLSFAAQKRHSSLYLMGLYTGSADEAAFRDRWAGGKALDMGKSCVRFRDLADLDLPLLAETIAATSVDAFIDRYERSRAD